MPLLIPPLETPEDCIAFAQKVNPKREHLTIEKLRSYPGFEQYTDEQAIQTIQSIEQFTLIIIEIAMQNNSISIDNQQFVNSPGDDELQTIPIHCNKKNAA